MWILIFITVVDVIVNVLLTTTTIILSQPYFKASCRNVQAELWEVTFCMKLKFGDLGCRGEMLILLVRW